MRFQPQAAVLPQLSFGAEAVRRLHHRDQNGCPDRTDPRNLAQQFPRLVLPALSQEIFPHLLAQEMHDIELLVVVFGASPDADFADLAEPFRAITLCMTNCSSASHELQLDSHLYPQPTCGRLQWPKNGSTQSFLLRRCSVRGG